MLNVITFNLNLIQLIYFCFTHFSCFTAWITFMLARGGGKASGDDDN